MHDRWYGKRKWNDSSEYGNNTEFCDNRCCDFYGSDSESII